MASSSHHKPSRVPRFRQAQARLRLASLAAIALFALQATSVQGIAIATSTPLAAAQLVPRYSANGDRDAHLPLARHEGMHHDDENDEEESSASAMSHEHEHAHFANGVQSSKSSASDFSDTLADAVAWASSVVNSPSSSMPQASAAHSHGPGISSSHADDASSTHDHDHGHEHIHSHGGSHSHSHAPHPYDGVPDPSAAGLDFIVVPPLPKGAGGHSHGHGNEAPAAEINETTILRGKGPDPLSYIEWDFAFGIGKADELVRFANAYEGDFVNVMGVAGGRWRTLLDERDNSTRKEVALDIQSRIGIDGRNPGRHPVLLALHVIGCILSCFVLLPVALALRAAHSNLAPAASLLYLATLAGSLALSWLYRIMTPQLFPKHAHKGLGYAIFWLSLLALGSDVFRLVGQIWSVIVSTRGSSRSQRLQAALRTLASRGAKGGHLQDVYDAEEEERMLSDDGSGASDARDIHAAQLGARPIRHDSDSTVHSRSVHFEHEDDDHEGRAHRDALFSRNQGNDHFVNTWRDCTRSGSSGDQMPSPTSTLCNTPQASVLGDTSNKGQHSSIHSKISTTKRHPMQVIKSIIRYSNVTLARSLPVLSFAAAYTGLSVYTGSCRGPYKNVCLAHGIKGGVFFWYGLLTFGRYMGAYADKGWAWNRRPGMKKGETYLSGEWIECFVILVYGSTNTWMERFGAKAGDPYTVKQVQHISIAVMFWFSGLLGLALETPSLKSLLAVPVVLKHKQSGRSRTLRGEDAYKAEVLVRDVTPPPSYAFSFNPFPALVIGVTGIAMAAHHQDYIYEVSIHALWGNLLAGFSVLRMLTYFLLWLRPPSNSIMPSRPPTEALASFSLTCGGFVFMLSSEEVSFAAMRNGFGDFMMILNVTVALVSLLFCWVAGLMVIKAWAVQREHRRAMSRDADGAVRLDESGQRHSNGSADASAHRSREHTSEKNAQTQAGVFIIEDDNEEDQLLQQGEKRQFASSPMQA